MALQKEFKTDSGLVGNYWFLAAHTFKTKREVITTDEVETINYRNYIAIDLQLYIDENSKKVDKVGAIYAYQTIIFEFTWSEFDEFMVLNNTRDPRAFAYEKARGNEYFSDAINC